MGMISLINIYSPWFQGSVEQGSVVMKFTQKKHLLSSMIIYYHLWSSIIIYYDHLWSSMIIYYHLLSYIIIYYHLLSSILIYYHLLSSIIIYYHLLSSIIIYYHLLSSIIIYYHLLSSIIIYYPMISYICPIYSHRLLVWFPVMKFTQIGGKFAESPLGMVAMGFSIVMGMVPPSERASIGWWVYHGKFHQWMRTTIVGLPPWVRKYIMRIYRKI